MAAKSLIKTHKLPILEIKISGWNVRTLNFMNDQSKFIEIPKVEKPMNKKMLL